MSTSMLNPQKQSECTCSKLYSSTLHISTTHRLIFNMVECQNKSKKKVPTNQIQLVHMYLGRSLPKQRFASVTVNGPPTEMLSKEHMIKNERL